MKCISVFIIALALVSCYARVPEKTGHEGEMLPAFNILLPDSITRVDTKDITNGHPSVLFLFGAHCPFCKAQMDEIIRGRDKLKGFQIYVFTNTSFAEMKSFYNKFHLEKYPNIHVGFDYENFFTDYFKAPGVPYIAVYGEDKKLRKAFLGGLRSSEIKKAAE